MDDNLKKMAEDKLKEFGIYGEIEDVLRWVEWLASEKLKQIKKDEPYAVNEIQDMKIVAVIADHLMSEL